MSDSTMRELLGMPLYQITDEYLALVDILTENGGELTDDLAESWTAIRGTLKEKVERCAIVVRELECRSEKAAEEGQRLYDRAKRYGDSAKRLRAYMQGQMERADMGKVEGDLCTVSIRNNPPKVEIVNEDLLTEEYVEVETTIKPNRRALLDAWKASGLAPAGCIVTRGKSLQIK